MRVSLGVNMDGTRDGEVDVSGGRDMWMQDTPGSEKENWERPENSAPPSATLAGLFSLPRMPSLPVHSCAYNFTSL